MLSVTGMKLGSLMHIAMLWLMWLVLLMLLGQPVSTR